MSSLYLYLSKLDVETRFLAAGITQEASRAYATRCRGSRRGSTCKDSRPSLLVQELQQRAQSLEGHVAIQLG